MNSFFVCDYVILSGESLRFIYLSSTDFKMHTVPHSKILCCSFLGQIWDKYWAKNVITKFNQLLGLSIFDPNMG